MTFGELRARFANLTKEVPDDWLVIVDDGKPDGNLDIGQPDRPRDGSIGWYAAERKNDPGAYVVRARLVDMQAWVDANNPGAPIVPCIVWKWVF